MHFHSPSLTCILGVMLSNSNSNAKIWLSHSGLEIMDRCPRCFWLYYNKRIYQPEGIVSRLANRFDALIKRYFNAFRGGSELPPLVTGLIEGRLENPFQEQYFAAISDKYGFKGKLDECLARDDRTYTPVDHKTSSSDPRIEREMFPAYQAQLDSYAFLLERNRKPSSGIGHLIYYYPDDGDRLHEGLKLAVVVKTLNTDPLAAMGRIERGIGVLEKDMPLPSSSCPFCSWRRSLDEL